MKKKKTGIIVMDINGLGGFGISGEAYNYKNETDVNISQLYYDAMKGTMTSEQKEIFKEIKTWTNDNVFYKNNFYTSIVNISGDEESKLGSEENYQTYKHVIDKYLER